MTGDEIRRCEANTRTGQRCKRLAKVGGSFCGLHDGSGRAPGAPQGNANARKHGFYGQLFSPQEIEDLAVAAAAGDLADEIGLLRIRLKRALEEGVDLDAIGRACGRLTQMLKAQRVLTGDAASQFEQAMAEVLDGLVEELGLGLSPKNR